MGQHIIFGSDHAGFDLKQHLVSLLKEKGFSVEDLGVFDSATSANYAPMGHMVAERIQKEEALGILICGTGIGISIAANRHRGVRAALCHNVFTATSARTHNNANILALGARVLSTSDAEACVLAFLESTFEGGRHIERVEAIDVL